MEKWVNPNYTDLVEQVERIKKERTPEMANCGYCKGLGRTIIKDEKTKKVHTITCAMCKGSGEVPDEK